MKRGWLFSLLALILAALACNWSEVAPPAAPVIEPSPLPTFAIPTLTPTPTETPLPTPTSTPDVPIAWPKDLGVNCRYGPAKTWESVSSLPAGTRTEIEGRSVDASWWYVSDPLHLDEFCWVAADVVETAGNMNFISIVEAPTVLVTNVTADVLVTFTACGEANPVTFNGSISANGPAKVAYHWEVTGDVQETFSDTSLNYAQAGTQEVTTSDFSADCGDYTVTLRVTAPHEIFAEQAFQILAP